MMRAYIKTGIKSQRLREIISFKRYLRRGKDQMITNLFGKNGRVKKCLKCFVD